ncbi:ATP-binding protein [Brassicibacter mesophilus]|uniref:ATP-binding protein n=1 Tax=Brassicibacter mesophilus TaxID=745119 RepID=UPI003D1F8944
MHGIKIGKNAIENLTIGMYSESKIIFREYIQNAADQIDKAISTNMFPEEDLCIEINIEPNLRYIAIKDNATGIPRVDVAKKLAYVADSEKEKGVDKGFRGIGRLGGLAYCDTLRFITSYKGERVKTIMTWDAKQLVQLIEDNTVKDSAEEVLQEVIKYDEEPCGEEEHFFIVEMLGIRKENSELLNIEAVRKYVSSNAPIAYQSKFYFRTKIYDFLKKHSLPLNEYKIFINDEDVFKLYTTYLYDNKTGQKRKYDDIFDIQIKTFERSNGELLAWMWYGISSFEKTIPESVNDMKGIRLRQANIQLGDERTLSGFFKEPRGNSYFVGEIHAVHKELVPNARRDYFNENIARVELEAHLKYYFADTLHKLYHGANKAKNAFKKDISLKQKQIEYQEKQKNGFVDKKEQEKIEHEIEQKKAENEKAIKEIRNLKAKVAYGEPLDKVIKKIEKNYQQKIKSDMICKTTEVNEPPAQPLEKQSIKRPTLIVDELSKLSKKERKLVSKIYSIINDILPPDLSQNLIKKIQEELKK